MTTGVHPRWQGWSRVGGARPAAASLPLGHWEGHNPLGLLCCGSGTTVLTPCVEGSEPRVQRPRPGASILLEGGLARGPEQREEPQVSTQGLQKRLPSLCLLGMGGGWFTSRIASLERQGPWGQTGDTVSTRALCFPSFLPDVSWNPAHLKAGPKGSRIVKPKGVLVTVQTEAESFPRKVQEVVPAPAHAGPSGQGQGRCQESPDEGRSGRGWGCPGGWRDSGRAHGGTLSPKPPSVLQALPVAAEDSGWHIMVLPFLRGGPRGNGGGGACPGWAPRSSTAFHVEPPFRKDRDMVSTRAAGDCMTRATCISRVGPAGRPGRQCNRNSLPTDEETGFGDRVTHAAQRSKCWNTPWSRPWTLGLRFFSESGF